MNTISKAKTFAAALLLGLSLPSCNDWLDVDMEDQVLESALFSDYEGYCTALNGVYLSMNDIYSTSLTTTVLDIMAQYYNVTTANNHKFKLYSSYTYSDNEFETTNANVWARCYTLIANVNMVIERTEGETPLTERQRAIIRGEALALRAFIHFDLLRLYGPIYSENPTAESIPYYKSSSREIQPILPADQALANVIADLREAETLLKGYDPIITEGVRNTSVVENGLSSYDLSFRQLRMNYYAVQAMLARAYLWQGDKATAYDIAKHNIIDKVTTEELEVFPWTTQSQVEDKDKPDYLFSSEVIFSLYNTKRMTNVRDPFFAPTLAAKTSRLTFFGTDMQSATSKMPSFYDDLNNDLRAKMWEVVEPTDEEKKAAEESWWAPAATNTLALKKYDDIQSGNSTETYRYMIPLIRMSEVYFIAAECATSQAEGCELINTVRNHRLCSSMKDTDDFNTVLTYEMAREVIGEGQLFYFYKRRAAEQLISGTAATPYTMIKTNYVWPIPKAETDKRANINK